MAQHAQTGQPHTRDDSDRQQLRLEQLLPLRCTAVDLSAEAGPHASCRQDLGVRWHGLAVGDLYRLMHQHRFRPRQRRTRRP